MREWPGLSLVEAWSLPVGEALAMFRVAFERDVKPEPQAKPEVTPEGFVHAPGVSALLRKLRGEER